MAQAIKVVLESRIERIKTELLGADVKDVPGLQQEAEGLRVLLRRIFLQ